MPVGREDAAARNGELIRFPRRCRPALNVPGPGAGASPRARAANTEPSIAPLAAAGTAGSARFRSHSRAIALTASASHALSGRLARQGDALFLRPLAHPFVMLVADLLTFLLGAGDLTIATGSCALFNELTSLNGCACVPSPRNPVSLCADFKAFGEYVSAAFRDFPAVLAGEKLEATRSARLDRDLELVIDAAMNARAALRTLSEGASPSSLPCANGGIPRERTE